MELKDIVLAAIGDIQKEEEIQKLKEIEQNVSKSENIRKQKTSSVKKIPKKDEKPLRTSAQQVEKEQIANFLNEEKFLKKLKERILVLFEGFSSPKNKNIEDKLDITINFLEYLLSLVDERIEIIDKKNRK